MDYIVKILLYYNNNIILYRRVSRGGGKGPAPYPLEIKKKVF